MVIFFIIKRTVWDRYLQVVIVKLDAINAAPTTTMVVLFYRGGAGEARGAHNSEDVGSKPTSGIVKLDAINAAPTTTMVVLFYRGGAGEARGAHNPEVIRSIRISGIIPKSYK